MKIIASTPLFFPTHSMYVSSPKHSCQISDRDIQCDFDNDFWEESDCNWRYNHSLVLTSLGVDSYQLIREKVTTNFTNYWRSNDTKAGNFFQKIVAYSF